MRKSIVFILFVCLFISMTAQNKPSYKVYGSKGGKVSFKKMLKKMKKAEIVLFGEHHNNPIIHWLQLETISELHNSRPLTLGAEMIETDNQDQLNKYLSGEITQYELDTTARLWKNYATDYKPLVDFAKRHDLKFIATNIPRMYASKVFRGGF